MKKARVVRLGFFGSIYSFAQLEIFGKWTTLSTIRTGGVVLML